MPSLLLKRYQIVIEVVILEEYFRVGAFNPYCSVVIGKNEMRQLLTASTKLYRVSSEKIIECGMKGSFLGEPFF